MPVITTVVAWQREEDDDDDEAGKVFFFGEWIGDKLIILMELTFFPVTVMLVWWKEEYREI